MTKPIDSSVRVAGGGGTGETRRTQRQGVRTLGVEAKQQGTPQLLIHAGAVAD
jgi:hypothetical protein